jgi:hypothetical protein
MTEWHNRELEKLIAKKRDELLVLAGDMHEEGIYSSSSQQVLLYVIDRSNRKLPPIPTTALDTLFKMYVAEALVDGKYYGKLKDESHNLTSTKERTVNLNRIKRPDRKQFLLTIKSHYSEYVNAIKEMEQSSMRAHWASFNTEVEKGILDLDSIQGIQKIAKIAEDAVEQILPFMV